MRETWAAISPHEERAPLAECAIEYKADTGAPYPGQWPPEEARGNPDTPKWRPSVHMPRWAARLWLEVLSVRVEQLQEITPNDIVDEGYFSYATTILTLPEPGAFVRAWNELNARRGYPWESNPWVWAYTFRRIEEPTP